METEGMKHMSHEHPLTLIEYNNTPENAACYGCRDTLTVGKSVYRCSRNRGESTASQDSECAMFFLDKKCTKLPPHIHDPRHEAHHLSLYDLYWRNGNCCVCHTECRERFLYRCKSCKVYVCLKCAMQERKLNHEFHSHPLTLLPLKSVFPCGACGVKNIEEFSYLCQTCLFWIHKSCAPKTVICKLHHSDHPLLLSDSFILKSYETEGLFCSICQLKFDKRYWLYYCLDCRFFAHVQCATKPIEENSTEVDDEEDVNQSELMQFPIYADKPYLYYQLIQDLAKTHSSTSTNNHISTTEDGTISHCTSGHPLSLIAEHMRKDINDFDELLCGGCFQPLSITADPFYGCVDCKQFLHKVCSTELPMAIKHPSHPEHMILRCLQIGKTITCDICKNECSRIFYQCEKSSCSFIMDIMCASVPRKIKHESHKHSLFQLEKFKSHSCYGCNGLSRPCSFFSCKVCPFELHVGCAISSGTIKHRWDEHLLCLVYPPVKHHPHEFNCEFCSKDVNPNYWFYHCQKCDMSFHLNCVKKGILLANSSRHNLRFPDMICAIM